jgi:hypothetical protein
MAKRDDLNTSGRVRGGEADSMTDSKEQRLVAFAEQLGWIVGTIQGKAEGWLDSDALTAQISEARDSASALLDQLRPAKIAGSRGASRANPNGAGLKEKAALRSKGAGNRRAAGKAKMSAKGTVSSKVSASATSGATNTLGGEKGRSGGAVDAPGKKHRKPMPSESGATGTPRGEGSRIAKLKAHNQNRMQRRG